MPSWAYLLAVAGLMALLAVVLLMMGRVPWCECGYIKLWHGVVMSSENSQHVTDWYTPSHLIHGFGLYGVLWLLARSWPFGLRLTLATAVEVLWEIVENTDFVINRYREATIALDYYGDSVVNSVADVLACILGFLLAARLPVWAFPRTGACRISRPRRNRGGGLGAAVADRQPSSTPASLAGSQGSAPAPRAGQRHPEVGAARR